EIAEFYDFPPDATGAGESIAVLELGGGYRRQDLVDYFQRLGVPPPRITNASVAGAGNQPGLWPTEPDSEVTLDLEMVGALAPGADITVYFSFNTNLGFILALAQAVHDSRRRHSVISISWAESEESWAPMEIAAMNDLLWEAAVLGITVCVASGDHGSSSESPPSDGWAHVEFPASSPFALACGGTTLLRREGQPIAGEVVWHQWSGGAWWASGGGASTAFPVPPYQARAGI